MPKTLVETLMKIGRTRVRTDSRIDSRGAMPSWQADLTEWRPDGLVEDRVPAEGHVTVRLTDVEPLGGLEPLAMAIDQRDGAQGHVQGLRDEVDDVLERRLLLAVQDLVAFEGADPGLVVALEV